MPIATEKIENLVPVVMFLVLTAIVGGVGAIIIGEFIIDQTTVTTITNQSLVAGQTNWTSRNSTATTNFLEINSGYVLSNTTLNDITGGVTVTTTTGAITYNLSIVNNSGAYNLTYTYDIKAGGGGAYDTFVAGIEAVEEVAGWLDIIALVISATVILALVLGVLSYIQNRNRGQNRGGDFY